MNTERAQSKDLPEVDKRLQRGGMFLAPFSGVIWNLTGLGQRPQAEEVGMALFRCVSTSGCLQCA